jgi:hypothetical protein
VGKTLTSITIIVTAQLITQLIPRSNLWASLESSEINQSGPILPRPLRGGCHNHPIWGLNEGSTRQTPREGAVDFRFPTYPLLKSRRPRDSSARTPGVVIIRQDAECSQPYHPLGMSIAPFWAWPVPRLYSASFELFQITNPACIFLPVFSLAAATTTCDDGRRRTTT